MYANYCYSSDRSALKPGMIIAVSSHPYTTAGKIYGHVGIYIGNNTVMDNIGYIRTCSADYWISYYGASVTVRWGWAKGIVLVARHPSASIRPPHPTCPLVSPARQVGYT